VDVREVRFQALQSVVVDSSGKLHHIPKKDSDEPRDIGYLMPEALTPAMSNGEQRDLTRTLRFAIS
jgi:hypothetical protein